MVESLFSEIEALHKYIKFIKECELKKYENVILEKHHIIPKFILRKMNPNATKKELDENNVIMLSREDHILAHTLLSKCYYDYTENYIKNIWAVQILTKHKSSNIIKNNIRYGKNNPFYGKCHSDETKNKIREYTKRTRTNVSYKQLYLTEQRIKDEISKRNITRSKTFENNRQKFIKDNNIEFIENSPCIKIKGIIYDNIKTATKILGLPKNKLYNLKKYFYGKHNNKTKTN